MKRQLGTEGTNLLMWRQVWRKCIILGRVSAREAWGHYSSLLGLGNHRLPHGRHHPWVVLGRHHAKTLELPIRR